MESAETPRDSTSSVYLPLSTKGKSGKILKQCIEIIPGTLVFRFSNTWPVTATLIIRNISTSDVHLQIISPLTPFFKTSTNEFVVLAGKEAEAIVEFLPDDKHRYYYDCIRVAQVGDLEKHCIPIHYFPCDHHIKMPSVINLGKIAIGERYSAAVYTEFVFNFAPKLYGFHVTPNSGCLQPGDGETQVEVSYAPTDTRPAAVQLCLHVNPACLPTLVCNIQAAVVSRGHLKLKEKIADAMAPSASSSNARNLKKQPTVSRAGNTHPRKKEQVVSYSLNVNKSSGSRVPGSDGSKTGQTSQRSEGTNQVVADRFRWMFDTKLSQNEKQSIFAEEMRRYADEERRVGLRIHPRLGEPVWTEECNVTDQQFRYRLVEKQRSSCSNTIYYNHRLLKVRDDQEIVHELEPTFDVAESDPWPHRLRMVDLFTQAIRRVVTKIRLERNLVKLKDAVQRMKLEQEQEPNCQKVTIGAGCVQTKKWSTLCLQETKTAKNQQYDRFPLSVEDRNRFMPEFKSQEGGQLSPDQIIEQLKKFALQGHTFAPEVNM